MLLGLLVLTDFDLKQTEVTVQLLFLLLMFKPVFLCYVPFIRELYKIIVQWLIATLQKFATAA